MCGGYSLFRSDYSLFEMIFSRSHAMQTRLLLTSLCWSSFTTISVATASLSCRGKYHKWICLNCSTAILELLDNTYFEG